MANLQKDPTEEKPRGLIAWFADNHVAANILMGFLVIGGIFSASNMRRETFPAIDPLSISVSVVYPGATPYEVEEAITSRISEAVKGIEGIDRTVATASEGVASVSIALKDFADGDQVYNDIETAVNGLPNFPPEDAERPIISRARVTPQVMTLALFGDVSEQILRVWAERIEDDLVLLEGVSLTTISGIRPYEISIEVAEENLQRYGLTMEQIAQVVSRFSSDVPAGNIESSQGDTLLRVQERRYQGPDFERIALRTRADGSELTLGEVATVVDGFEDTNLVSRFNRKRAAFIDIQRSETQDTITVAETVKNYIDTLSLPKGLELVIEQDQTTVVADRISLMLRNAVIGFALVFLILLLFLDLKLAVWTSAAIPISFLGGLVFLYFTGQSLNMISLFALIVVLGIVVDDGVVTGESIFEEQDKAKGDKRAVLRGVNAVIAPVTIGVLTTIAAFAPLLLSTGTLGQIIGVVPVVVIPILVVSLIEAYFILPAHLSNPRRWSMGPLAKIRDIFAKGLAWIVARVVEPVAEFCMRWRYATVAAFMGLFVVTLGLLGGGVIKFVFFPPIESDTISISLKMPVGTPFVVTEATVKEIEDAIFNVEKEFSNERSPIVSISTSIGQSDSVGAGPARGESSTGAHLASLTLQLLPSDFRDFSAQEIESKIRTKVKDLPGIKELTFRSSLAGTDPDIEMELSHPREADLIAASETLQNQIRNTKGAINVSSSFDEGKTELLYELTPEGLAAGLTPQELGRQLRSAYFGLEAQRIQRGSSNLIVYIRYPKEERENLATLEETRIRLPNGSEAPLSAIAQHRTQTGFSQIKSVNGRRVVSILGDAETSIASPNEITRIIETEYMPALIERYPGLSYSYAGESRDQREDLKSLAQNMLIALLIIYVLLGGQLRSYTQPFIIMAAIPMGAVGAILGHYVLGFQLTFISFFGIVALTGVVINDSVVLLDFINICLKKGDSLFDAIHQGISRRFRPILLTSMSTCFGLLPILTETSLQARFLQPMVVSLAAGILLVTPIVLLLVPCLLMIWNDLKQILSIR